jgi:hypothetical protein
MLKTNKNNNVIDNNMIETFCRMIDVIDETKNDDFRSMMFDVSTNNVHVENNNNDDDDFRSMKLSMM